MKRSSGRYIVMPDEPLPETVGGALARLQAEMREVIRKAPWYVRAYVNFRLFVTRPARTRAARRYQRLMLDRIRVAVDGIMLAAEEDQR